MLKKNKGFTLIELLAVIVILSIIMVIAVPIVIKNLEDAKKGSFKSDAMGILNAIDYKLTLDNKYNIEQINVDKIYSDLKLSNKNYQEIKVQRDFRGKIYINVVGKNDWQGLIACGAYENMIVTSNSEDCPEVPPAGALYWLGEEIRSWTEDFSDTDKIIPIKRDNFIGFKIEHNGFMEESSYILTEKINLDNWNYIKAEVDRQLDDRYGEGEHREKREIITADISEITGDYYVRIYAAADYASPLGHAYGAFVHITENLNEETCRGWGPYDVCRPMGNFGIVHLCFIVI